jgi:hypothetical protein
MTSPLHMLTCTCIHNNKIHPSNTTSLPSSFKIMTRSSLPLSFSKPLSAVCRCKMYSSSVSRTWTTINNSPALQQHLFLAYVERSPGHETRWTRNPLLAEKFQVWFGDIRISRRFFTDGNNPNPLQNKGQHSGAFKIYPFGDVYALKKSDWAASPDA